MIFLIGLISGICTGIGIGGGAILVLLLDLFLNFNQHSSQAINLICFIPAALLTIFFNIKNKNIDIHFSLPILLFGILGAVIGSLISKNMNVYFLKKLFGIFLIIISICEIFDLYDFIKNKKQL